MTEETLVEREPEPCPSHAEEALASKRGTLERGIKDAWHGGVAATTSAAEGVKTAATTTMHAIQGAAHDTGKAMGRAFDFPAHVRRHPWLMVGGAMLVGAATGYLLRRLCR